MKQKIKKIILGIIIFTGVLFLYTQLDKTPSRETVSKKLLGWKSNEEIFKYRNHKLSYHDSGDYSKEVIVLLHGYPTSSFDWSTLWSELSTDYRLIAMDMLGFGFSDKPDNIEYTISMQTDILEALLSELNIKKMNIVAHDYGDNVTQELLARNIEQRDKYPFKLKSVTLLNGGLFPETHHPTTIQKLLSSPIGKMVASLTNQTLFNKNFSKVFGQKTKPTKQELIDHWYLICHQKGYKIAHKLTHASKDREKNRERWVSSLLKTKVSLFYITGQVDPVTGMETTERYIELFSNKNIIVLDEIGHYPQLESPKKVLQAIKQHINQGLLN